MTGTTITFVGDPPGSYGSGGSGWTPGTQPSASAATLPCCVHGIPSGARCFTCQPATPAPQGWSCPRCQHVYGPHISECSRCPQPSPILGPLTAANHTRDCDRQHGPGSCPLPAAIIGIPPEMTDPGHVHVNVVRLGDEWREVWRDGSLQCRAVSSGEGVVQIHLRITPPDD